jgi:hypothetical protein
MSFFSNAMELSERKYRSMAPHPGAILSIALQPSSQLVTMAYDTAATYGNMYIIHDDHHGLGMFTTDGKHVMGQPMRTNIKRFTRA